MLKLEELEQRCLLSVYTPSQIRHGYGFDQLALTGAGETIAIVDAYYSPGVFSDLHTFDQTFGLPDPVLLTVNQNGGRPSGSRNSGWALETSLDVEWAHAIAPGATILLVEASNASLGNLLTAVDYARNQSNVVTVSMSWGSNEFSSETSYDFHFTTPAGHRGITFIAAAGDTGGKVIWPSASPNVLSVGGTTLMLDSQGNYLGESAWSSGGGGYSLYESEPSWQLGVQTSGHRSTPDVAYDGDPNTGVYVYRGGWYAVGGTSIGAPQWAALIALADQGRAQKGVGSLNAAQSVLYSLPKLDFHDITTGSNGFPATVGYDLATGLGSPIANLLVLDLVNTTQSSTTSAPIGKPHHQAVNFLFAELAHNHFQLENYWEM